MLYSRYLHWQESMWHHISIMTSRVGIEEEDPAWQVLSAWNLLNHCLIFFQYIMSGKKFREESKTAFNAIVASFRLNLFGN